MQQNFFFHLYCLVCNDITALLLFLASCLFKCTLFIKVISHKERGQRPHPAQIYLMLILFAGAFSDLAWLMLKFSNLGFLEITIVRIFSRISWCLVPMLFGAQSLLILSLKDQKRTLLNSRHMLLIIPYALITLTLLYQLCINGGIRMVQLETQILSIIKHFYIPTTAFALYVLYSIRNLDLPRIIRSQIQTFLTFFILPYLAVELFQDWLEDCSATVVYTLPLQVLISASAFLFTCSLYYCLKCLLRLRFLNMKPQVYAANQTCFLDTLKNTVSDLAKLTTFDRIVQRTKQFFADAFEVPQEQTTLKLRSFNYITGTLSNTDIAVENFLSRCLLDAELRDFVQETKVLIFDELACSNFYYESRVLSIVIAFMEEIKADIFVVMQDGSKITAYLTVGRHARSRLYTNVERDQMMMFAEHLSITLYMHENQNHEALVLRERELKAELFCVRQQYQQVRESVWSFICNAKQRQLGVVFYRNNKLIYGNKAAQELIALGSAPADIFLQAIKKLAVEVESYKAPQYSVVESHAGKKLAFSAFPGTVPHEATVIVHQPEISDMIHAQLDRLPEPSDWDHLLVLETTGIGQLISQFLPGQSKAILPAKIALLKAALNKKPVSLVMSVEDSMSAARLLAKLSRHQQFHHVDLEKTDPRSLAQLLFGVPPSFSSASQPGLLRELDESGTLFLEHIEHCDMAVQKMLAEFMATGSYRLFGREQTISSAARIVVASKLDLQDMLKSQMIHESLFTELRKNIISLPSLLSLSDQDYLELADGYAGQILLLKEYANLFALAKTDKKHLLERKQVSLQALKAKVRMLMLQKSKNTGLADEGGLEAVQVVEDADLTEAARLGKQALRDPRIMSVLWAKLKSPNMIASFLGVNRTSVYRRIKEYNLGS